MKLQVSAWKEAQAAHEARTDNLTRAHSERKARGEKHAVEDFMFSYYRLSVGKLREWHPGHGATLLGSDEELEGYRSPTQYLRGPDGLTLNSAPLMEKRQSTVTYALNLLERTARACLLTGDRSVADRGLETDEIAVGVSDEELLDAGFVAVVDAVPLRLGRHEQRVVRPSQRGEDRTQVWDADLEVGPSSKGRFQWSGDPVSADTLLLKHDVSGP